MINNSISFNHIEMLKKSSALLDALLLHSSIWQLEALSM